jgi:hypothetical protein
MSFHSLFHAQTVITRTFLTLLSHYTIWRGDEFVYIGIAGRNLNLAVEHKRIRGERDRLDSHRAGRRSGDQFAVYVCDRFVLPELTQDEIKRIAAGNLSLDAKTRVYKRAHSQQYAGQRPVPAEKLEEPVYIWALIVGNR